MIEKIEWMLNGIRWSMLTLNWIIASAKMRKLNQSAANIYSWLHFEEIQFGLLFQIECNQNLIKWKFEYDELHSIKSYL